MRKYISECLLKDNDIEKLLRKIKKITWYCYIEKVINQLIKHKINFYFIGGMIRDLIIEILNKKKTNRKLNLQDVDIVVETGSFEYLMSIIKKVNFETKYKIIPHPEFLTISILLFPHQTTYRIDMSIVRKETYPSSGSLPVVSAGSIYEDLLRRDFTVNAIALKYECEKNKYTIFDPFNGIKDLINKKIRVLHDKSFVDDPTRIIRAIQYASRLEFMVEPKTTGLIKEAVNNKLLNRVSKNRLTNEFVNILQKGENLCLVSKMFKKYNIVEFYKFLHPIIDVFITYCKNIEFDKFKRTYLQERFYMRILYILEKICGEIKIGEKNKISQFKKYLVMLGIPKIQRQPIYQAIEYFANRKNKKNIPFWVRFYSQFFKN